MSAEDPRIGRAHAQMNAKNAADPHRFDTPTGARPRELVLAEELEKWVRRVAAEPSVPLLLASRGQHIERWAIARTSYPMDRVGYLKWRKDLAKHHADVVSGILAEVGFDQATIEATRAINLKADLKGNPDTQAMEDALCLSFLENEYTEFAAKHPDDKVVDIVQKTWRKMSPRGHELALTLPLDGRAKELVLRALGG